MPLPSHADRELLQAALAGFQQRLEQIDQKMAEIKAMLGGKAAPAAPGDDGTPAQAGRKRRKMSAAARRRIAAAQRKRRAAAKAGQQAAPKKRRLSAAGRNRIIEATKKRWTEFRARKAAG
ncbi:MAG TPA: hypothetical protein VE959_33515 [Bryobacteraceae bacterium]|nr:hypothetical protein [Bryobacteraceae bacterium]